LGVQAHFNYKSKEALSFFDRAVELDPNFALAYLAAGRTYGYLGDVPNIRREFDLANKYRTHLAPREVLILDAQLARFGAVDPMLQRWEQLITMYPDNHDAHFVLGVELMFRANKFSAALEHAKAAAAVQNPQRETALNLQGMVLAGLDRLDEGLRAFDAARKFGFKGSDDDYARAYAAKRDFDDARRVLRSRHSTGSAVGDLRTPQQAMLFAIDEGNWKAAMEQASLGRKAADTAEPLLAGPEWRINSLTVDALAGRTDRARIEQDLLAELKRVHERREETDRVASNYSEILALSIGYLGGTIDSLPVVQGALAELSKSSDIKGFPLMVQLHEVLLAEQDRLRGNAAAASLRLAPLAQSDDALIAVRAALARAARGAKQSALALRQWDWIATHRGRAYMEWGAEGSLKPWNVASTTLARLESAELRAGAGDKAGAKRDLATFLAAWPESTLPPMLRQRVKQLQAQSA